MEDDMLKLDTTSFKAIGAVVTVVPPSNCRCVLTTVCKNPPSLSLANIAPTAGTGVLADKFTVPALVSAAVTCWALIITTCTFGKIAGVLSVTLT